MFMDLDYGQNMVDTKASFRQSLFVHARVISVNVKTGKRVLDAGTKAIDLLCGIPKVRCGVWRCVLMWCGLVGRSVCGVVWLACTSHVPLLRRCIQSNATTSTRTLCTCTAHAQVTSITDRTLASKLESVTFHNGGDEHGVLRDVPEDLLPLGSTVQLVPSHCDPTVNLHKEFNAVRVVMDLDSGEDGGGSDPVVEHVWTIDC